MRLQGSSAAVGGDPALLLRIRDSAALVGTYDGINRAFILPNGEKAIHDPPNAQVKVYHNGRRLLPMEYEMRESVSGQGFDQVCICYFSPHNTSRLYADYIVVV